MVAIKIFVALCYAIPAVFLFAGGCWMFFGAVINWPTLELGAILMMVVVGTACSLVAAALAAALAGAFAGAF